MLNLKRLAMTASLLERVDEARHHNPEMPKGFDLGRWDCGTAACAVGHAIHDLAHQIEGLQSVPLPLELNRGRLSPFFDGKQGWPAVKAFYGLTLGEALHLFGGPFYEPSERTDAMAVAKRIQAFVAAHDRELVPA